MARTKQNLNITVDKEKFAEVKQYLDKNLINTSRFFNSMMEEEAQILKISRDFEISYTVAKAIVCFGYLNSELDLFQNDEKLNISSNLWKILREKCNNLTQEDFDNIIDYID